MKSAPVLAAALAVSMTVLMARHRCIRAQFFSVCLKNYCATYLHHARHIASGRTRFIPTRSGVVR